MSTTIVRQAPKEITDRISLTIEKQIFAGMKSIDWDMGIKVFLIGLLSCLQAIHLSAQLVPPFVEEEFGSDWSDPVLLTYDNSGQGYVVERHGLVWMIDDEGNKSAQPFVDITEEVGMFGDHGLLGFALHPLYETNRYVYLLYVVDRHHLMEFGTPDYDPNKTIIEQATIGRITRYTADPSTNYTTVIPESRKVILGATPETGFPVLMASHGVGSLAFGTDYSLLASCGDAGSFLSIDKGSASETYFQQALEDGILKPKENVGCYRAQLIDCLNGKIIRIDPETGDGLPSNPYFDPSNPSSAASKVWALGLRQPFRFIHRPETGSHNIADGDPGVFVIGDVGRSAFEELNVVDRPGMNFGWPLYEGPGELDLFQDTSILNADAPNPEANGGCSMYYPYTSLIRQPIRSGIPSFENPCDPTEEISPDLRFVHTPPLISWTNEKYNPPTRAVIHTWNDNGTIRAITIESDDSQVEGLNFEGSSSIPGFFYDGDAFPEEYRGKLFVCDFTGWIRVFDIDNENVLHAVDTLHTDIRRVVGMAVNPKDGLVYHINQFNRIDRISYGGNSAPSPLIVVDRQYGPGPLTISFDGTGSTDANGDPLTYHWDFGDGGESTDAQPVHTFTGHNGDPTAFTVTLTVSDTAGGSRSTSIIIGVDNSPPAVDITSIEDGQLYSTDGVNAFELIADVSDSEHEKSSLHYAWQIFLHHNDHFHPEFPIEAETATADLPPTLCNGETYYYRVRLEVTDPLGLVSFDEVELFPYCGDPILDFLELDAWVDDAAVQLEWTAEGADEIEEYIIERARRFESFRELGRVDDFERNYTDGIPLLGAATYRIKAVRADGVYTYSNNVDINYIAEGLELRVWPNPASTELNFLFSMTESTVVDFSLYTPTGALVLSRRWSNLIPTNSMEQMLDVSQLIPGMYYYTIRDGDRQLHGSVVIANK